MRNADLPIADCGLRIADFEWQSRLVETMLRVELASREGAGSEESAIRNPQSAIG